MTGYAFPMVHGLPIFPAVAFGALLLAGCGEGAQQQAPVAGPDARGTVVAASGPPPAFAQCRSCHSVVPGQNGVGPSLHGVFGAKAASQPGVTYSDALKASGLTWDAATLDRWLAGPTVLVPGTRMVLAPIPDPARRKAIIDYIATLK